MRQYCSLMQYHNYSVTSDRWSRNIKLSKRNKINLTKGNRNQRDFALKQMDNNWGQIIAMAPFKWSWRGKKLSALTNIAKFSPFIICWVTLKRRWQKWEEVHVSFQVWMIREGFFKEWRRAMMSVLCRHCVLEIKWQRSKEAKIRFHCQREYIKIEEMTPL